MTNSALGLIEVEGYLGIIAVADTALKSANVKIIELEKIAGGISTLQISGDVGAVNAAVEAAAKEAIHLNCYRSSHVIPRVDESVLAMIKNDTGGEKKPEVSESIKVVKKENKKN